LELRSEIAYGTYGNQRITLRGKNLIFEKWFPRDCNNFPELSGKIFNIEM